MANTVSSSPTALATSAPTIAATDPTQSIAGTVSGFAAPYISDMLGKGMALSGMGFTPYSGDLAAGASNLQNQAFQGIAGLTTPGKGPMDVFTADRAAQYANPFVSNVISPQLREAQRQAEIQRINNAGKLVGAGAFGGSRQAIMEAEGNRNLQTLMSDITGKGYQQAFENAQQQFERDRGYGLDALTRQLAGGEAQRGIEQQGLSADYEQYMRQFNYPKEQLQLQSELLKNIPERALTTQNTYGVAPSTLSKLLGAGSGILGLLSAANTLGGNTSGLGNIYSGISNLFSGFGSNSDSGMYAPGAFGDGDPSGNIFEGIDIGDYFNDDFLGYD
jgi:hypothetical protein